MVQGNQKVNKHTQGKKVMTEIDIRFYMEIQYGKNHNYQDDKKPINYITIYKYLHSNYHYLTP